jgi:uncharacterized membrane protein YdjX (TVP38/TMEM64 family)
MSAFHDLALATPPPGRFELTTPRLVAAVAAVVPLIAIVFGPVRRALFDCIFLLASGRLGQFQQYLQSLGAWAPIVSVAIMVAEALVVPAPVAIIMVANGLVFGLWPGMLVSLAGGLLGAILAYAIGRRFGRALVQRVLPSSALVAADRLMAQHGDWAILVCRLIPGVPGDPMSYVAGLTQMSVVRFLLLTTLGLLPTNLVTAYVGVHVAGDIPLRDWLFGIAAVATFWISWRALRHRKRGRTSVDGSPLA